MRIRAAAYVEAGSSAGRRSKSVGAQPFKRSTSFVNEARHACCTGRTADSRRHRAAAVYVKRRGELRSADFAVSVVAVVLLLVPTVMLFYSVPAAPQRWFVYYFLLFLAAGWAWFALSRRSAGAR